MEFEAATSEFGMQMQHRWQFPYRQEMRPAARSFSNESPNWARLMSGGQYELLIGLVALMVLVWLSSSIGLVDCRASPIACRSGTEFDATMNVASGRSCVLSTRIGSSEVTDLVIDTPPRHGTIQRRGRTGAIYRPIAPYTGEDFFGITLNGRSKSGNGAMIVRVKVAVQ